MNQTELIERISQAIPKYSVGRYDLIALFSDHKLFNEIVDYLAAPFVGKVDCVVALEATGWILGVAIAQKLKVPFVPIRKGGKLPYPDSMLYSVSLVDYSKKEKRLALKKDALKGIDRVVLVDEWIETGGQIKAALELLENFQSEVVGCATISIRGEEDKLQNLEWIRQKFVHYIGISIRRQESK